MRHILRLIVLLPLVLAACAQGVFYQPDRTLYGTPAQAGLAFEEVSFVSQDGTRLSGWFIPASTSITPREARGTVVHFHGNAENMSSHWRLVEWLPRHGYNLFVFDYRGYGNSAGTPDARGLFDDSNSALNHVRQRTDIDPQRLLLLGQSLGGAQAISVLGSGNREGVQALVVESTFYSYSSIANDHFSGAGLLMDNAFSPEAYLSALAPTPLLLLHGTADEVTPFHHARLLLKGSNTQTRFIAIPLGHHLEAFSVRFDDRYKDAVIRFFEDALQTAAKPPAPARQDAQGRPLVDPG